MKRRRKPAPLPRRLATTTELDQANNIPSADLSEERAALADTAPDDGVEEAEPETGPLRRCIVSRARLPKEQMIRFVVGPDRAIVPDLAARLPGRGIWLSASGDVIEPPGAKGDAYRQLTRAFARAARGPVSVPPDLPVVLQTALIRRIADSLGLARRAGQAVAGFEKAREWMRSGQARLVVQASDGSEAERARFLSGAAETLAVIDPLPGAALGRVFGRDFVVHVAIAPGRLAETLAVEAARLAGLRRVTLKEAPRPGAGQESAGLNKDAGAG